jgi:hypothetical protein
VSIEHALYGFWLFTVGLGGYFAFPRGMRAGGAAPTGINKLTIDVSAAE